MHKKLLVSAIVLLFFNQAAKSQQIGMQRNPKLGIGTEVILGDTKYGTGYFLNFQSPIAQDLNWTVTLEKTSLQSTLKVMPRPKYKNFTTKVGAKYFLTRALYCAGDLGVAFDQIQEKNTRFAWSSGLGAEINVFGKSVLDIGGQYEAYESTNSLKFFALKIALNLGLTR
jgi:opacity protein-like surface antigen